MKIAFVAAMDFEIDNLIYSLNNAEQKNVLGTNVVTGSIHDKDIIAIKCNIGKVNAAVATQTILLYHDIDCVINIGIAGSLEHLPIGCAAISKSVIQHDIDTSVLGDPIGFIDGLDASFLSCDQNIIDALSLSAKDVDLPYSVQNYATGDKFLLKDEMDRLNQTLNVCVFDMEFGAIAQTCYKAGVLFGCCKVISDNGHSNVQYEQFKRSSAHKSIDLIKKFALYYK